MNDPDSEISKGQCISLPSVLSFLHAADTEEPHAIIFLFKNEIVLSPRQQGVHACTCACGEECRILSSAMLSILDFFSLIFFSNFKT